MEALLGFVPAILPIVLPPLIALVRAKVAAIVPTQYVPMALAAGGAILGALSTFLGVDSPELGVGVGIDAWNGALIGLASVGVHQLFRKGIKPKTP